MHIEEQLSHDKIMNANSIGATIKARRQELKINQQTLADLSGVGINTIVSIERGMGNPSLENLLKIGHTLGMNLEFKV